MAADTENEILDDGTVLGIPANRAGGSPDPNDLVEVVDGKRVRKDEKAAQDSADKDAGTVTTKKASPANKSRTADNK